MNLTSADTAVQVGVISRHAPAVVAAVQSGNARLRAASITRDQLTGDARLVLVDEEHAEPVCDRVLAVAPRATIVVLSRVLNPGILDLSLMSETIAGFLGVSSEAGPEPWQVMYVARRILVPKEPAPTGGDLLPWGSTSVMWRPTTTGELVRIVADLDGICRKAGLSAHDAAAVTSVAHELLVNAMHDAPVDFTGRPVYAGDRAASVRLGTHQAPTMRLTISAEHVAVDVQDPFGRLARPRFFGGVLLGLQNRMSKMPIDTSFGAASLGLVSALCSGQLLRAEVDPGRSTLVSWVRKRQNGAPLAAPSLVYLARR